MGHEAEVREVIALIKRERARWQISHRAKNLQAMVELGIDLDQTLEEIYNHITWQDYVSGPEDDNHNPIIPGPVWVFGMELEEIECYLKFQVKSSRIIFWISVHPAKYPLNYPYK